MHDIDPLNKFQCQCCGDKFPVPSLARDHEDKDRAAAAGVEWLPKPVKVKRP